MARLPKSIIKKYGVSKKAWSVFRSMRSGSQRKTAKVVNVARRRFSRRAFTRSRVYRRARKGGRTLQPLVNAALAGAVVGLGLKFLPSQYNTPLVRAGLGVGAAYMGSGFVKNAGELLVGMEVARITNSIAGGMTTTATSTSSTVY